MTANTLQQARTAFRRRQWTDAYTLLTAADAEQPLPPGDLEQLATAAHLIGRDQESEALWTRAHQEHLRTGGSLPDAARCAFWLAFGLMRRGERARAAAWLTRARQMLESGGQECVEHGYLLLPAALERLFAGDAATSFDTFSRAAEIAERFGDRDLRALACHSRGRVLIRMGAIADGVRLLDAAMVAVDAGDVSAIVVGDVYCSVIEGCLEIFDLRRAHEWTAALSRWCESQPDLVPYRGQCLVRRSEVLQVNGAWRAALEDARAACARLEQPSIQPACGAAYYQCGELYRLRGEFAAAGEAYACANRYGRSPQPGQALLRLAQGDTEQADTTIRLALDAARGLPARPRVLEAGVEIMLAAGDAAGARRAAEELEALAADLNAAALHGAAAQALGAVLLREGDARAALTVLRRGLSCCQDVEAIYEAARTRVLIGAASQTLGDLDTAAMEFDAARRTFRQLGARPDLRRLETLCPPVARRPDGGLSGREIQVLRLVAAGRTNRQIAGELSISERTVERHLSNIFNKIDVPSRAAATAYAYEHRLV